MTKNSLTPFNTINPTDIEKNEWLQRFNKSQRGFVQKCIDSAVEFSKGDYERFFKGCGLYAVGSSTIRKPHNDVDIVLVGLDFRAAVEYDKIFLRDPETLIREEIVVRPYKFHIIKDGEEDGKMVLRPVSQDGGLGSLLSSGIEHKGQRYDYDSDRLWTDALSLRNYCDRHASPSELVVRLRNFLKTKMNSMIFGISNPFEPYANIFCEDPNNKEKYFLVTRFQIYPLDPSSSANLPVPGDFSLPFPPIDFIVHTENLTLDSWIDYQRKANLPFVPLHTWEHTYSGQRPVLTNLNLPSFINPDGKKNHRASFKNNEINSPI